MAHLGQECLPPRVELHADRVVADGDGGAPGTAQSGITGEVWA